MTLNHLALDPREVEALIHEELEKLRLELMLKVIQPENVILEYKPMTVGVPVSGTWSNHRRKNRRRSKVPFVMRGVYQGKHIRSRYRTFEALAAAVRRL